VTFAVGTAGFGAVLRGYLGYTAVGAAPLAITLPTVPTRVKIVRTDTKDVRTRVHLRILTMDDAELL